VHAGPGISLSRIELLFNPAGADSTNGELNDPAALRGIPASGRVRRHHLRSKAMAGRVASANPTPSDWLKQSI
jgi:hypothetical protein